MIKYEFKKFKTMKTLQLYTLLISTILYISCGGQKQTSAPSVNIKPETKNIFTGDAPQAITRNIIQDKNGNIWMAAFDGVFRYDGKSFTNITRKKDKFYTVESELQKEMSSARYFSILEDRKGTLWFGSIGSGVYSYDGKTFKNYKTKDGLLNNEVVSIFEDKEGNIWFGVSGGASCYNGQSFRNFILDAEFMKEDLTGKVFFENRQPYEVNSIIEDKKGKFWFATRGNTFVYDPAVKSSASSQKFTVFTQGNKAFKNVRSLIQDKESNIWLSGNDGLWRYDGSSFTNFNQGFVGYVMEDKKGNIWICSDKNGKGWSLSKYDAKTLSNKIPTGTEISNQPMIFGIFEDNLENIWFGSLKGVHRYDGKTVTDFNNKEGEK
jgi:ligand-binding sensor domain-containing protein